MIEDIGALIDSQKRTQTPKDSTRLDYYRTLEEVRSSVWFSLIDIDANLCERDEG